MTHTTSRPQTQLATPPNKLHPGPELLAALPDHMRAHVTKVAPGLDVDSTSLRDSTRLMAALTKGTLQGALGWGGQHVGFRDVLWYFGFTERAVAEGKPLAHGLLPLAIESDEVPDGSPDMFREIQRAAVQARRAILNEQ